MSTGLVDECQICKGVGYLYACSMCRASYHVICLEQEYEGHPEPSCSPSRSWNCPKCVTLHSDDSGDRASDIDGLQVAKPQPALTSKQDSRSFVTLRRSDRKRPNSSNVQEPGTSGNQLRLLFEKRHMAKKTQEKATGVIPEQRERVRIPRCRLDSDLDESNLVEWPANLNKKEKIELRRWAGVAHDTDQKAPNKSLRPWIYPIRFASIQKMNSQGPQLEPTVNNFDVLDLTAKEFRRLAESGEKFVTPLLIREKFADADLINHEAYANKLEETFPNSKINVRYHDSDPELILCSEAANFIRRPPHTVLKKRPNFLDLQNISDAIKPDLARIPRFQALRRLELGAKAKFAGNSGKQILYTPYDVGSCQAFDIVGLRGAFSGAHMDALGGTWLRNLFGVKLWMIVPQSLMTDEDWDQFARDGDDWNPGSKSRALILRPNDVFFMPPGLNVIHAVMTLETSLMAGGMLWDELNLSSVLRTVCWIGKHQKTTNEALPFQLEGILAQLEVDIELNPKRYINKKELNQAIEHLRELGCGCASCDEAEDCSCARHNRRCTLLCEAHSMDSMTDCMEETGNMAEPSDGNSSIFSDY